MFIGVIWIVVGLTVALWSGITGSDVLAAANLPLAVSGVAGQWHLTLTGMLGLVLAAEGCRMAQSGWYYRQRYS
jgi:hypothetical protein